MTDNPLLSAQAQIEGACGAEAGHGMIATVTRHSPSGRTFPSGGQQVAPGRRRIEILDQTVAVVTEKGTHAMLDHVAGKIRGRADAGNGPAPFGMCLRIIDEQLRVLTKGLPIRLGFRAIDFHLRHGNRLVRGLVGHPRHIKAPERHRDQMQPHGIVPAPRVDASLDGLEQIDRVVLRKGFFDPDATKGHGRFQITRRVVIVKLGRRGLRERMATGEYTTEPKGNREAVRNKTWHGVRLPRYAMAVADRHGHNRTGASAVKRMCTGAGQHR